MYYQILQAVKAVLESEFENVVIRKKPMHSLDQDDPLPFVCLSPERESIASMQHGKTVCYDYSVLVSLYTTRSGAIESADEIQDQLEYRETIRDLLFKTKLAGIESVWDCNYEANPTFEDLLFDQSMDVSVQRFLFRTREYRV